jgi:hypothetical protein
MLPQSGPSFMVTVRGTVNPNARITLEDGEGGGRGDRGGRGKGRINYSLYSIAISPLREKVRISCIKLQLKDLVHL